MEADDKDRADALTAAMESAEAPIDTFRRQLEELQRLQPFLPVDTFSKAVGALSEEFSRADPTIQAWLRDLERAGAILQANETPLDSYNRALEELTRLHEAGALSAAQFERVLGNLDAGLYEQLQALNETNDAVRDFGLVFTSAFEDAAVAGADFNEVLGGLVEDLHRLALRLIVTEPLLKALEQAFKDLKATDITTFFAKVASWLGALIPGYAAPASGTQVDTAPSVPPVPVAAATNPAFASSMAAAGATSMTGAVTVNVINNANNTTVSQQQTTGPNGSVQLDVMIDEMMAGQAASPNNAYARTMRGTYGLQPQLIGR
jgi:hypothetical protein